MIWSLLPLTLLLVGVELGFRVFWEPPPRPPELDLEMVPHPTRLWALNPGKVTAAGLVHTIDRDQLRAVPDTGAPYRAFTVGDSSIFGHGLEDPDTLHHHLSQALAQAGTPTDVFCGAVPGYSTEQALVVLDEVGWDLDLDLLVIGTLWSDNNFDNFVDAVWMAELNQPSRRVDFFLLRFHAWQWLRRARHPDRPNEGLPVGWIRSPEEPELGRRRVPVDDYARNLDRMLVQAADRGVGVLMLEPCNRERLKAEGGAAWDLYFRTMEQVASAREVPLVDACEALRRAELGPEQAFLDEMHPTGLSNEAYAELAVETLQASGWPELPPPTR